MKNIILIFLLVIACYCSNACSYFKGKKPPIPAAPAEELYSKGMDLYRKSDFLSAFDNFQQCRTRYPLSDLGMKSELKMADCLYYQKQYETAFTKYQEFSRLHPRYKFIDYVYFQMGMSYYKRVCESDRDQTFSQEAVKNFENLIRLFPSSHYIPSARQKIEKCKKKMAAHILYIANYYSRTKAYNSALNRYREALQDYRDYIASPDQLMFQIGKLYLRADLPDNARDQFIELVKEYPKSPLATEAESLLEDPSRAEKTEDVQISVK
jgi:outer membrane protein assembly factor BamD